MAYHPKIAFTIIRAFSSRRQYSSYNTAILTISGYQVHVKHFFFFFFFFVSVNIRLTRWRWKRCLPGFFKESTSHGVCAGISAFRGICFIPTLGSLHMHHRSSSSACCLCGIKCCSQTIPKQWALWYVLFLLYNVVKASLIITIH